MNGWYTEGTEAVFACGGKIYTSATKAATAGANKWVIGVDTDQSKESPTIITSALKGIANSVTLALGKLYDNNKTWPADMAGQASVLGAKDDCVGLPMETSKFTAFNAEQYNAVLEGVKNGTIPVSNVTDVKPTVSVVVEYQQ